MSQNATVLALFGAAAHTFPVCIRLSTDTDGDGGVECCRQRASQISMQGSDGRRPPISPV